MLFTDVESCKTSRRFARILQAVAVLFRKQAGHAITEQCTINAKALTPFPYVHLFHHGPTDVGPELQIPKKFQENDFDRLFAKKNIALAKKQRRSVDSQKRVFPSVRRLFRIASENGRTTRGRQAQSPTRQRPRTGKLKYRKEIRFLTNKKYL